MYIAYLHCNILAYIDIRSEGNSFRGEQRDSSLYNLFGQLHRRYTVLEQSTDSVVSFEYGHRVTRFVQLMSGG